jgi:hypothetical protein
MPLKVNSTGKLVSVGGYIMCVCFPDSVEIAGLYVDFAFDEGEPTNLYELDTFTATGGPCLYEGNADIIGGITTTITVRLSYSGTQWEFSISDSGGSFYVVPDAQPNFGKPQIGPDGTYDQPNSATTCTVTAL